MNHRIYLRCEVCSSIILTKTQVGYLENHPIRINCKKCGILISGVFKSDQKNARFNLNFDNAIEIDSLNIKPNYFIQLSGELLTQKIKDYNPNTDEFSISPFLQTVAAMDNKNVKNKSITHPFIEFNQNFNDFLQFKKANWLKVRRINELWLSKKYIYLKEQIRNELSTKDYPLNNLYELLRGKQKINTVILCNVLSENFYDKIAKNIKLEFDKINKSDPQNFKEMIEYFGGNGYLNQYNHHIFDAITTFVEKYQYFITAIGLKKFKKRPDFEQNGITSVSIEDIKSFYIDMYENISNIMNLNIALNNIKYRKNYTLMEPTVINKIDKLEDFIKMRNKGNKINFYNKSEFFINVINIDLDNKLRNALGHASYKYNGTTQEMIYFPSGNFNDPNAKKIYLIEFIEKTLAMFETIILLNEIVYQAEKWYLIFQENISVSSINKVKIGRNDPCSCGSEKKYKKCCGI